MTLVVFGRAPVAGRCKTRLIPRLGADGAAALYAAMLEDTCRLAAGFSAVLCVDEEHPVLQTLATTFGMTLTLQGPGDLGARMKRAVLAAGGPVCVIGSDLPTLGVADVQAGFAALASNEVVLGPALDGGYWLVGLRTATLTDAVFDDIPWSTPSVYATTMARVPAFALAMHADVDSPADLDQLLAADVGPATRRALSLLASPP